MKASERHWVFLWMTQNLGLWFFVLVVPASRPSYSVGLFVAIACFNVLVALPELRRERHPRDSP